MPQRTGGCQYKTVKLIFWGREEELVVKIVPKTDLTCIVWKLAQNNQLLTCVYCTYNVKTVNILPPAQILECVLVYKNLPKIADH